MRAVRHYERSAICWLLWRAWWFRPLRPLWQRFYNAHILGYVYWSGERWERL